MKAYVIKNKEGKYWRSKFDKEGNILLTDDIVDAMPYEEDELKMLECPKDCTIVPITICEGDLEKALEIAAEKIEFMAQMLGQTLDYDIKENLIQQAKESKDE